MFFKVGIQQKTRRSPSSRNRRQTAIKCIRTRFRTSCRGARRAADGRLRKKTFTFPTVLSSASCDRRALRWLKGVD